MKQKERTVPIVILILEALQKRLLEGHPARAQVKEELGRRSAGYRGEQILDYYAKYLPLQKHHFIFHDLRLPISSEAFFQIDTLILTPYYLLIFEGKHMAGKLFFDPKQLIRELNNVEESFPNPIVQVKNQRYFLKVLLEKYSFPFLPCEAFVVITNSKSIILPNPDYKEVLETVIRPQALRFGFELVGKKHAKPILSDNELVKISELLLRLHTPDEPVVLGQYGLNKSEMMPGIYCEECGEFSVKRLKRFWRCHICSKKADKAFIQSLIDYRLLIRTTITNREFREFFGVDSIHTASKLLNSLNLPTRGERRHRKYELSLDYLLSLL